MDISLYPGAPSLSQLGWASWNRWCNCKIFMRPVISGCLLFCIFTNKYSACPKISSHVGDGSTPRAKTRPTNCEPTAERQSHSTAAAEVKRERSLPLPISTHLAPHFSTNVAAQSVCRGRGERWWRPYAPTTSPKLLS